MSGQAGRARTGRGGGQGRRAVLAAGAGAVASLAAGGGYLQASGVDVLEPLASAYLEPRIARVTLVERPYASAYHIGSGR
jgi:hypothetical protein